MGHALLTVWACKDFNWTGNASGQLRRFLPVVLSVFTSYGFWCVILVWCHFSIIVGRLFAMGLGD